MNRLKYHIELFRRLYALAKMIRFDKNNGKVVFTEDIITTESIIYQYPLKNLENETTNSN